MVDSLAMFFGAKKRKVRRSPSRKPKSSGGSVVVRGKERKLHKGSNGGLYYKTKSGRAYVDAKFIRAHSSRASPKRRRASPKRRRASPKRRRASPKRRRASPKRRRASPKRRRASPKRRLTRYGYGLGQPSLIDMMGPAGLVIPTHYTPPTVNVFEPHPNGFIPKRN
jgi:hypothetical protein